MCSLNPDLDIKGIAFFICHSYFEKNNLCYLMSSLLSFYLTIDIVENKEMSFVCFCVPCAVTVVIIEALIPVWLAASYLIQNMSRI